MGPLLAIACLLYLRFRTKILTSSTDFNLNFNFSSKTLKIINILYWVCISVAIISYYQAPPYYRPPIFFFSISLGAALLGLEIPLSNFKNINDKVKEIAKRAGIELGEAIVIMLAKAKGFPALIDDSAARIFAIGLRLQVTGSIGVLIKVAKAGIITKEEALGGLEKLTKVMWLSVDVYKDARKTIEDLK